MIQGRETNARQSDEAQHEASGPGMLKIYTKSCKKDIMEL